MVIVQLIGIFYHIHEHFEAADEDCITISEDKLAITSITSDRPLWTHSIYMHTWIKSCSKIMMTWSFRIDHLTRNIYFGFASMQHRVDGPFCSWNKAPSYLIQDKESTRHDSHTTRNGLNVGHHMLIQYAHCNISITLDLLNRKIWCQIDGHPRRMIIDNIDIGRHISYKMAMSLQDEDDEVTLLQCYQHQ